MKNKIVESCGCVFCDLGLEPDNVLGYMPVHMHPGKGIGYSFCTADELAAALPPPPEQHEKQVDDAG